MRSLLTFEQKRRMLHVHIERHNRAHYPHLYSKHDCSATLDYNDTIDRSAERLGCDFFDRPLH
jgi:hypothetical protein